MSYGEEIRGKLLFGDTHLHTSYSFDAFMNQNHSADPDTAYRWAKGKPVIHPFSGVRVQIKTPLDFLVVSDHAEGMGVVRALSSNTAIEPDLGLFASLKRWVAVRMLRDAVKDPKEGYELFASLLPKAAANASGDPVTDPNHNSPKSRSTLGDTLQTETRSWHEIVDAAEEHNEPGKFTSLIGWEWSSVPTGANLHRVVLTPDGGKHAKQFVPFGSDDGEYPEELWQWLDKTSQETGTRFLAIPHNSNISKGYMFAETSLKGRPITQEYARTRIKWEPVVEVTQIKGDSETHPKLSPQDEFADFETYTSYIQTGGGTYEAKPADFVRSALKRGMAIEEKVGVNPYKFGMIGSTDAHTGIASAEEDNFWGKFAGDSVPAQKDGSHEEGGPIGNGWEMSASGLAAVWVNENTRDEIYAAFKRKEVYATTGPRIAVRMFAGWKFEDGAHDAEDLAKIGYAQGVPMGGDLLPQPENSQSAPSLLIRATKDPVAANLDRIQVVKGWVDSAGEQHEKVYNVSWAGDRNVRADGSLPPIGNTVDLNTGHYENSIGSPELSVVWQDPDFEPDHRSFYYVRVLQIPTPRHSLLDGIALKIDPPKEGPATLQERAYTSPIWYTPQT
ncbi:DUF3604 domain-containing protein [Pseudovibrio axinellae]|nr:DUF3604 domain-containing protein [Pseudovibrio axinellae]